MASETHRGDGKGIQDPLRPLPASRHPFQFLVMFALAISGGSVVFLTGATPGSIEEVLPVWASNFWGLIMFFGGTLAIVAAFWPDRITGLLMERIALGAIGGTCIIYAVALIGVYRGQNGILNSTLFVCIFVACLWRIRHINRELDVLSRWIGWKGEADA